MGSMRKNRLSHYKEDCLIYAKRLKIKIELIPADNSIIAFFVNKAICF